MCTNNIVQRMIEYSEHILTVNTHREVDFVNSENLPEWIPANRLLLENPFAFLLGVIYDQGQLSERGWRYPFQLHQTIGNLTPEIIIQKRLVELDQLFFETRPRLRYWRVASARTLRAAETLCMDYEADARQIWLRDDPSPGTIQERFQQFDGISQKKSSMATNILYRDLQWISVAEEELQQIDISYDLHVRRVFLRAGIIDIDNVNVLVNTAREIYPNYPAALDLPAWYIGRNFCSNIAPNCNVCPLCEVCLKRTNYRVG